MRYMREDPDFQQVMEKQLEDLGSMSAPPAASIPKQWFPHFLRLPILWVNVACVQFELAIHKIAKWIVRPPFKRMGKCRRRGNCCYIILTRHYRGILGKWMLFWCTQVYGFYLREKPLFEYNGKYMRVMGCRHLRKDGRCAIYRLRPKECREWPVIEHFGHPKILKGCGFYLKNRKGRQHPLSIID